MNISPSQSQGLLRPLSSFNHVDHPLRSSVSPSHESFPSRIQFGANDLFPWMGDGRPRKPWGIRPKIFGFCLVLLGIAVPGLIFIENDRHTALRTTVAKEFTIATPEHQKELRIKTFLFGPKDKAFFILENLTHENKDLRELANSLISDLPEDPNHRVKEKITIYANTLKGKAAGTATVSDATLQEMRSTLESEVTQTWQYNKYPWQAFNLNL